MKRKPDRLKRALQATVLELIAHGEEHGLKPRAHKVLHHAMKELGWGVPKEVDFDKVLAELTSDDYEDIKGANESHRPDGPSERDPLTTNGDTP